MSQQAADTSLQALLVDQSTILDTPHHDVPERHEIGKALLAPGLPKPIGIAATGTSPAPARADHVHGVGSGGSTVNPDNLPRGVLARGSWLTPPIAIPAGGPTNVSNQLSFLPISGRMYRCRVQARAAAANGAGTFAGKVQIYGLSNLDHWFLWPFTAGGWGFINAWFDFPGDGAAKTWTLQVSNITVAGQIYGTDFLVEDIGIT